MRTAIAPLELVRPGSLDNALRRLRHDPELVPLAGCTDLYVELNFGTLTGRRFLDLWGLDGLRGIARRDGTLTIGALATYTRIIESPEAREHLPMLAAASREIGGVQIQSRGTLGGNIANASPAGDTLPVLAAVDAVVVLRNVERERRVPITDFYTGYRQTVMAPDELIIAVEVPPVEGRQWFRKVGTRAAQAISKVIVAAVRGPRPAVALGSVAPTPIRLPRTEACLADGGSIDEAARLLEAEIHPIDDLRSTAEYRRRVSTNLLRRFWEDTAP